MLEMIQGAYNGLKTALDTVQGIIALKSEADINKAVIDIQRNVLEAQRALMEADALHATDLKRIAELEQQIARVEAWKADKERFQLRAVDAGAFAYMHKPGMENGDPAMWLCQTCFEQGYKSILQFRAQDVGAGGALGRGQRSRWGCNQCKAEITVFYTRKPSVAWEPSSEPTTPQVPEPPKVNRDGGTWTRARR